MVELTKKTNRSAARFSETHLQNRVCEGVDFGKVRKEARDPILNEGWRGKLIELGNGHKNGPVENRVELVDRPIDRLDGVVDINPIDGTFLFKVREFEDCRLVAERGLLFGGNALTGGQQGDR